MIIKICGMREAENIRAVERLAPDMMGFICWEGSGRYVSRPPAHLPDICRVGVFVNPNVEQVVGKVKELGLNRLQLHGEESAELCTAIAAATGLPVIKAISVNTVSDIGKYHEYVTVTAIDLLLFDTKCGMMGGSGEMFDWGVLRHYDGEKPFLLAGGIAPGDEGRVLDFSHPKFAGIDLNSRFETAPAVKDVTKLETFINTIRHEQNK